MEGVLEGLLYVAGDDGLSLRDVCHVLEVSEEVAKELVYNLKMDYEKNNRGVRLRYLGNTFKLTTKEEHRKYFARLIDSPGSHVLSQAALEVLAIIAYNEPVTRMQIDEMRGVDSVYVIRKLVAQGLIKDVGKSDSPGRPLLYKTTDDFLDYFGLSSRDELPKLEDITSEIDEEKDLFKSKYGEIIEE